MNEFTWIPDFGADADITPTVTAVKFGDGYEQRFANGLNALPETWNLTFENRKRDEYDAIKAFLRARGAVEAFDWITPDGEIKRVVCRSFRRRIVKFNLYSLQASFEEVFEP